MPRSANAASRTRGGKGDACCDERASFDPLAHPPRRGMTTGRGAVVRRLAAFMSLLCRSNGRSEMNSKTQFHVISGRRVVATRNGPSAREVALDYLRAMGCKRDEIVYYGADGVSWRGAVYRAEPVEAVEPPLKLVELPPVSPR